MKTETKLVWKKLEANEVLTGRNFHISYNPDSSKSHGTELLTMLGNVLGGDVTDGEETALCYKGRFDILEGDFRKEYAVAFPKGLTACKRVFKKHEEEHRSNWTTD